MDLNRLDRFISCVGNESELHNLTILQVKESFSLAILQSFELQDKNEASEAELTPDLADDDNDENLENISTLVFCDWNFDFIDFMKIIRMEIKDKNKLFWCDFFCLDYENGYHIENWFSIINKKMEKVKEVVYIVDFSYDQKQSLMCLYQLFVAIKKDCHIRVLYSSKSFTEFIYYVEYGGEMALNDFFQGFFVDLEKENDDRYDLNSTLNELIVKKIKKDIKFEVFNKTIINHVVKWLKMLFDHMITKFNSIEKKYKFKWLLGLVLMRNDFFDMAEICFNDSLVLCCADKGENNIDVLNIRFDLAKLWCEQKKFKVAEKTFTNLVKMFVKELGPDHPSTLELKVHLGECYVFSGKYEKALVFLDECLKKQKKVLAPTDESLLRTFYIFGNLNFEFGSVSQAEVFLTECFNRRREKLGFNHPDTLNVLYKLASVFNSQRKYNDAETLFTLFLDRAKNIFKNSDIRLLTAENNLSNIYLVTKQYHKTLPILKKKLKNFHVAGDTQSLDFFLTMNDLGTLFLKMKFISKAIITYTDLIKRSKIVLGDNHPSYFIFLSNFERALASADGKEGQINIEHKKKKSFVFPRSFSAGDMSTEERSDEVSSISSAILRVLSESEVSSTEKKTEKEEEQLIAENLQLSAENKRAPLKTDKKSEKNQKSSTCIIS